MEGKAKAWLQGRRSRLQSAELSCKLWAPAFRREALESTEEAVSLHLHLTFLLQSWAGMGVGQELQSTGAIWASTTAPDWTQWNVSLSWPQPLSWKSCCSWEMLSWSCEPCSFSSEQVFFLSPFTEMAADARWISSFLSSGRTSRVDHTQ